MKTENQGGPSLISPNTLQYATGILGIALPIVLTVGSLAFGQATGLQSSLSDYYHTGMRNFFVAMICAIALFMFVYKGYEKRDSMTGNLACIFALGVTFFPSSVPDTMTAVIAEDVNYHVTGTIHFISAAGFFLVISYFSLFLFTRSSNRITAMKRKWNIIYRGAGYTILVCLTLMAAYNAGEETVFTSLQKLKPELWLETISLWAFGFSWMVKGGCFFSDSKTDGKVI